MVAPKPPAPVPTAKIDPAETYLKGALEYYRKTYHGKYVDTSPPPPEKLRWRGVSVELPHTPPDWFQLIRDYESRKRGIDGWMGDFIPMPNVDKLAPFEKAVGEALGGPVVSNIQKALDDLADAPWANTPLGRGVLGTLKGLSNAVLTFVDWGAQRAEQYYGLRLQLQADPGLIANALHSQEGRAELKAAWVAGMMSYEAMSKFAIRRTPQFRDPDWWKATWAQFRTRNRIEDMTDEERALNERYYPEMMAYLRAKPIPEGVPYGPDSEAWQQWALGKEEFYAQDTGGLQAIVEARKRLLAGVPYEKVYSDYMESLGALQIRAMVSEIMGHMLVDPFFIVLPFLKPVERIKSLRAIARLTKLAPEVEEATQATRAALIAARAAGTAEDSAKLLDEALAAAERLGVQEVTDALKVARESVEDAPKVASALDDVERVLARIDDLPKMGPVERKIVALTGGDPLNPPAYLAKPGVRGTLLRLVSLTPQARAAELIDNVAGHVGLLLERVRDPVAMYRSLKAVAAGSFSTRLGHMFLTPVGRYIQTTLRAAAGKVDDLFAAWLGTASERVAANEIARVLGSNVVDVVNAAGDPKLARVIFDKLEAAARVASKEELAASPILRGITQGTFGIQDVTIIGEVLRSTPSRIIPYTPELFRAAVMDAIGDSAAEVGIRMFGVGEARWFRKASMAVKQAEALLLLGLNPRYPLDNFFNNEVTMLARGVWSALLPGSIARKYPILARIFPTTDDVFRSFGIKPPRAEVGFGAAAGAGAENIFVRAMQEGDDIVYAAGMDALRAAQFPTPTGTRGRVMQFLGNLPDARRLASAMESWASQRAFAAAMSRTWPGVSQRLLTPLDVFDAGLASELKAVDPDLARILEDATRWARKQADLDQLVLAERLQLNTETITRRTAEALGLDPDDLVNAVGPDMLETIRHTLANLPEGAGRGDVMDAFDLIRANVQNSIEDRIAAHIPEVIAEAAAKAEAQGATGAAALIYDLSDNLYARQLAHAQMIETRVQEILPVKDPILRGRMWSSLMAESDASWARYRKWEQAVRKGIRQGLERRGVALPEAWDTAWDTYNKANRDFFSMRKALYDDLMKDLVAGKLDDPVEYAARLNEIQTKLDDAYQGLIRQFGDTSAVLDDIMIQQLRGSYDEALLRAWRQAVREGRLEDMLWHAEFRQSIRGLDREAAAFAWRGHWKARTLRWLQIKRTEQAGTAMLMGNEDAVRFFRELAGRMGAERVPAAEVARLIDENPVLANFDDVVGRLRYDGFGLDELWMSRGEEIFQQMEVQAIRALEEPGTRIASLPPDLQKRVLGYIEHLRPELNEARAATMSIAGGMRDSGLLNYQRTYGLDIVASYIFPFHFWYVHSILNWAVHSLDRPMVLAAFLRMRKFMQETPTLNRGMPARLRGKIRISVPFAPPELGDIYIDPLRMYGLPFERWIAGPEEIVRRMRGLEGATKEALRDLLRDGHITQMQYHEAMRTQEGEAWEMARGRAIEQDSSLSFDLMDFMQATISPRLPISFAWALATGQGKEVQALPPERAIRNTMALLGVDVGKYDDTWGNVRRAIGLPAYDQWDDYRIERELANMAGDGLITQRQARAAMARRGGDLWEMARQRAAKAQALGYFAPFLGIPAMAYPEGEKHQRELRDQFAAAYAAYTRGDTDALRDFFEAHPEYEARLALWDSPEEKTRQYLVDVIWDKWNNLSTLNRREVAEQLGPLFRQRFLDPDTRSYKGIDLEVLQMWALMMDPEAPTILHTKLTTLPELTPPDVSQRLEAFYEYRRRHFPGLFEVQEAYFRLDKGDARRQFLAQNPGLKEYWEWRREFMYRNPDLAPYIEDDPKKLPTYPSIQAYREAAAGQPAYTWLEWRSILTNPVANLVMDYYEGNPLPPAAQDRLNRTAADLGIEGGWRGLVEHIRATAPAGLTLP